ILRNCRAGVRPGGKLLLVELVLAPGDAADLGKALDLEMLVIASGRERTEAEYRPLLAGAGWRLTRVLPAKSPTPIVGAGPARNAFPHRAPHVRPPRDRIGPGRRRPPRGAPPGGGPLRRRPGGRLPRRRGGRPRPEAGAGRRQRARPDARPVAGVPDLA